MTEHAAAAPNWTFEQLNAFLTKPKDAVPGTSMGFAGLKKDDERANLIAWLNTQSASPLPLPTEAAAPAEAPAATDAAAPAEAPAATDGAAPAADPAAPAAN